MRRIEEYMATSQSGGITNERIFFTVVEFILGICFFLLFLIPSVIALIILFVGRKYEWRPWWFMVGGIAITGLMWLIGFINIYMDVLIYLYDLCQSITSEIMKGSYESGVTFQPLLDAIPNALIQMYPASVGFGSILGGVGLWLLIHRPELLRLPIKEKPRDELKTIKTFPKTALKSLEIPDGVVMGINEAGKAVLLRDKELNMHAFISGATGAGKTNTILVILESAIRRGKPVIVVDGKGDPGLITDIEGLCRQHDREFQAFSYKGSTHYNPLRHGDATELKDKMIAIEEWKETYYKRAAERYLQLAFKVMIQLKMKVDLVSLQRMLDTKLLMKALKRLKTDDADEMKEYVNTLDAGHKSAIDGLKDRLALLTESDVGPLFTDEPNAIDLLEAVLAKRVVVMSLSGLSHSSFTPALGAMIVEDLKTVAAAIGSRGRDDYIYVVLDEFNLFAGEQVVNMINKSRSAGFCCLIATQELADLAAAGGEELVAQVIGNTNVKIVHRQDVPSSADYMAEVVGTQKIYQKTLNTKESLLGKRPTGEGSVQTQDEYIVHPNVLKNLGQGQAVVIKKIPEMSAEPTQIRPAPMPKG